MVDIILPLNHATEEFLNYRSIWRLEALGGSRWSEPSEPTWTLGP